jgi:hypothetical protein
VEQAPVKAHLYLHVRSMCEQAKKSFRDSALNWLLRFIEFNIIGFSVFLIGTAIFVLAFGSFGEWMDMGNLQRLWGVLQFFLISFLNRTKIGKIFESSE